MSVRRIPTYKLFLALVPFLAVTWAQDSAPLVRSSSHLVLLDVVITDKDGHPIRGLTQNDFSVLENGAPQKITSFEASSTAGAEANPQATSARNLILLDQLNIDFLDLSYARDRILAFLDKNPAEKQPTALMAVSRSGLVMIQDFTQDKNLLKEKLLHLRAYDANPKGGIDLKLAEDYSKAALTALTQLARAAVGSPYSVNVIWVTSGFAGLLQTPNANDRLDAGLRGVANLLIRSRMRLYTIDPAGVTPLAATAAGAKVSRGSIRDGHQSSAEDLQNSTHGEAMTADVLLSHMTKIMGGLSFRGRNDVEIAISQAIEDGSSAYLISYSPSDTNFNGEYRNIEVHAGPAGSLARTRQGYYAVADDTKSERTIADTRLEDALSSPASYGALNVTCPATYDASKNHVTGKIIVTPNPATAAADQKEQVIRVASFAKDRKLLNSWLWRINWKDPWTNRAVSAAFDKEVSPKATIVRFLVSDAAADRIGTCEYLVP